MNADKIVALNIGLPNNNWQMHYKGFMLSVHIDMESENAGSVASGYNNAKAYTRMDVAVFDADRKDVTEAFFGPSNVGDGVWAVSSFTEFLEHANKFKERVDVNEMTQKMCKQTRPGVLGVSRNSAIKHIRDTGCIPVHTSCPFRSECQIANGGYCHHRGENHQAQFSCATVVFIRHLWQEVLNIFLCVQNQVLKK